MFSSFESGGGVYKEANATNLDTAINPRRRSSCPSIEVPVSNNEDPPLASPSARRRSWVSVDDSNEYFNMDETQQTHTESMWPGHSECDSLELPFGEGYNHILKSQVETSGMYPHTASAVYDREAYALEVCGTQSAYSDNQMFTLPDVYEVHFKRTKDMFFCESLNGNSPAFRAGDFVKVEADRGHDLGVVSKIISPSNSASYPFHDVPRRRVLALATEDEKAYLLSKVGDEWRALDICRELAARRHMNINVLDAEYQFDRRKLTFLFTSEKHTDFRELVRDLFALFKTRIWMQKINPAQAASLELESRGMTAPHHDLRRSSPPPRSNDHKQHYQSKMWLDLAEDDKSPVPSWAYTGERGATGKMHPHSHSHMLHRSSSQENAGILNYLPRTRDRTTDPRLRTPLHQTATQSNPKPSVGFGNWQERYNGMF